MSISARPWAWYAGKVLETSRLTAGSLAKRASPMRDERKKSRGGEIMYHTFSKRELCHTLAPRCECGSERVLNAHSLNGGAAWRWDWVCPNPQCDNGLVHVETAVVDAMQSALQRALREHRVVI